MVGHENLGVRFSWKREGAKEAKDAKERNIGVLRYEGIGCIGFCGPMHPVPCYSVVARQRADGGLLLHRRSWSAKGWVSLWRNWWCSAWATAVYPAYCLVLTAYYVMRHASYVMRRAVRGR
jgi:hypothetical protein